MHSKNCCIALAQLGKNASGVIKLAPLATSISCPGRRTGKVVCLCKHGKKAADGSHLACAFTKSTAGCYHVCKCTKNSPAGECALHSPATGRALPNSPTRVREPAMIGGLITVNMWSGLVSSVDMASRLANAEFSVHPNNSRFKAMKSAMGPTT
ncbi:hypothetical protein Ndes2526A_g01263 [Nannochloris sp. 'desiccata']